MEHANEKRHFVFFPIKSGSYCTPNIAFLRGRPVAGELFSLLVRNKVGKSPLTCTFDSHKVRQERPEDSLYYRSGRARNRNRGTHLFLYAILKILLWRRARSKAKRPMHHTHKVPHLLAQRQPITFSRRRTFRGGAASSTGECCTIAIFLHISQSLP